MKVNADIYFLHSASFQSHARAVVRVYSHAEALLHNIKVVAKLQPWAAISKRLRRSIQTARTHLSVPYSLIGPVLTHRSRTHSSVPYSLIGPVLTHRSRTHSSVPYSLIGPVLTHRSRTHSSVPYSLIGPVLTHPVLTHRSRTYLLGSGSV